MREVIFEGESWKAGMSPGEIGFYFLISSFPHFMFGRVCG
jgi:hypothetical protein